MRGSGRGGAGRGRSRPKQLLGEFNPSCQQPRNVPAGAGRWPCPCPVFPVPGSRPDVPSPWHLHGCGGDCGGDCAGPCCPRGSLVIAGGSCLAPAACRPRGPDPPPCALPTPPPAFTGQDRRCPRQDRVGTPGTFALQKNEPPALVKGPSGSSVATGVT